MRVPSYCSSRQNPSWGRRWLLLSTFPRFVFRVGASQISLAIDIPFNEAEDAALPIAHYACEVNNAGHFFCPDSFKDEEG